MTPAMGLIYDSISDLMDACIKELKRSSRIDTTDISLEKGLFQHLDEMVRRQLDAVWHTVLPKTKQARNGPIRCYYTMDDNHPALPSATHACSVQPCRRLA